MWLLNSLSTRNVNSDGINLIIIFICHIWGMVHKSVSIMSHISESSWVKILQKNYDKTFHLQEAALLGQWKMMYIAPGVKRRNAYMPHPKGTHTLTCDSWLLVPCVYCCCSGNVDRWLRFYVPQWPWWGCWSSSGHTGRSSPEWIPPPNWYRLEWNPQTSEDSPPEWTSGHWRHKNTHRN